MNLPRMLRSRRGQTAVEYILTTMALFVVFVSMYRFFGTFLPKQYKSGAKIILKSYQVDPW